MTPHPARVKKAEQAVVVAAMFQAGPWSHNNVALLRSCGTALDRACARLYLARLASKKRKGGSRA